MRTGIRYREGCAVPETSNPGPGTWRGAFTPRAAADKTAECPCPNNPVSRQARVATAVAGKPLPPEQQSRWSGGVLFSTPRSATHNVDYEKSRLWRVKLRAASLQTLAP